MRQSNTVFKWAGLAMGFIISTIGVITTAKDISTLGFPDYAWYAIGLYVFVVFAIWIIYGFWKDNKKLETELKGAKQYKAQAQRIEIISKEKYPSEILRIFDDMRRCLSETIESSDSITDITPSKLIDSIRGITPHELYLALHQKTIEDNVRATYTFYRGFSLDIGLGSLQKNNDKWKKLIEDYETTKKDVPDQQLIMSMRLHFEALNGAGAIRLYYRYMQKHGAGEMNIKAVEPFRPVADLLDQTMARVTKRILELKLGEEPKWEMLYFQEKK